MTFADRGAAQQRHAADSRISILLMLVEYALAADAWRYAAYLFAFGDSLKWSSLMRQFPKRAGLTLLVGVLAQFVFLLAAAMLGAPMLALVLLLPGWALVYAGRSSDPAWGLPVMLLINAVAYAPLIYLLLYVLRPFRRDETLSIRPK